MKYLRIVATGLVVVFASTAADARGGPGGGGSGYGGTVGHGASFYAPGQQFRAGGAVTGYHGASSYAPGHRFKKHGRRGASSYAPGYYVRH